MNPLGKIITAVISMVVLLVTIGWIETSNEFGELEITLTSTPVDQLAEDVYITVDSVALYSETEGWQTISQPDQTLSLRGIQGNGAVVLDNVQIPTDTYQQIELSLSAVTVVNTGGEIEARLPANDITFPAQVKISPSASSSLAFYIQTSNSLHETGSGQFVFLPRIHTESWHDVKNKKQLTTRTEIGMDQAGTSHYSFELTQNDSVNITREGVIEISRKSAQTEADIATSTELNHQQ